MNSETCTITSELCSEMLPDPFDCGGIFRAAVLLLESEREPGAESMGFVEKFLCGGNGSASPYAAYLWVFLFCKFGDQQFLISTVGAVKELKFVFQTVE